VLMSGDTFGENAVSIYLVGKQTTELTTGIPPQIKYDESARWVLVASAYALGNVKCIKVSIALLKRYFPTQPPRVLTLLRPAASMS